MNIRPATKYDIKSIQEIHKIVGPVNLGDSPEWEEYEVLEIMKDQLVFVATDNNNIVGFIFGTKLRPFGAMVWNAGVLPAYRSRLVGPKLIKYFEDSAKAQGIEWLISYLHNRDIPYGTKIQRNGNTIYIGDKYLEALTVLQGTHNGK